MGFVSYLTIVLIVLKICGIFTHSWLWVFLPFFIWFLTLIIVVILQLYIDGFIFTGKFRRKK